jgi:hypothetical protein
MGEGRYRRPRRPRERLKLGTFGRRYGLPM